jgi:hypothetical protein
MKRAGKRARALWGVWEGAARRCLSDVRSFERSAVAAAVSSVKEKSRAINHDPQKNRARTKKAIMHLT